MQDVDPPPALFRLGDHRRHRRFPGDVRLEGKTIAARVPHHRRGFLRQPELAIHRHDLRAFLREPQRRGAAVAHAGARALPGADDDCSF